MAHALLAPSGASRWIACTPSARLEAKFPDTAGEVAREGTLAHTLSELLLKEHLKLVQKHAFAKQLNVIRADALYNEAMLDHCINYMSFVLEQFADAQKHTKDALLFTERKIDLTEYVPEGFGTIDTSIVADTTLEIIDLKYGKGVMVEAKENRQMMLYALGALREYDYMYDIQKVRMTIHQPRIENYSSWEISVNALKQWAEIELKPKAALAFKGEGEFIPGSHCQFCRVKATCKAHADYHLETAKYDFKDPVLLNDAEIADILDRAKAFESWLTAVQDHALHESVHNNKKWPGYKLVEGRSNRQYADQEAVATKLLKAGFAEDMIYKKELLGITAMEKAISKSVFNSTLNDLIIKPPGKPALVPESDKRPEYNSAEAAKKDFETIQ